MPIIWCALSCAWKIKSTTNLYYVIQCQAKPRQIESSHYSNLRQISIRYNIFFCCCCYHFNDINSRVCFFLALHFSLFLFTLSLTHSLCIDLYRANTVIFRGAATKHHKISWHFAQLVTSKKKKSSLAVHTLVDMVNGRVLEHHK